MIYLFELVHTCVCGERGACMHVCMCTHVCACVCMCAHVFGDLNIN